MVKSIIVLISALAVVITASIFELVYFNSQLDYFNDNISMVIIQTEKKENASQKLEEITNWWKDKKKILNIFVPHNDLDGIDELLAETQAYINNTEYTYALAKLKRLEDTTKALPDKYSFCLGNIF